MIKNLLSLAVKTAVVLVVVLGILKLAGPLPFSMNLRNLNKDNSLFVTGEGVSFVKPDTASATVSVTINAPTAKEVQKQANDKVNKITSELLKLGLSDKSIKTTNYSIYPTYGNNGNTITGYTAYLSLTIKDKDLDRINKVLDTATSNGANVVSGVTFDVEDKDAALTDARKEGIEKAKKKAEEIAKQSGIRLGKIINVSEYMPVAYDLAPYAKADGLGGGGGGQTEVQPGQTEIKVNVTLTYEIL